MARTHSPYLFQVLFYFWHALKSLSHGHHFGKLGGQRPPTISYLSQQDLPPSSWISPGPERDLPL